MLQSYNNRCLQVGYLKSVIWLLRSSFFVYYIEKRGRKGKAVVKNAILEKEAKKYLPKVKRSVKIAKSTKTTGNSKETKRKPQTVISLRGAAEAGKVFLKKVKKAVDRNRQAVLI